MAKAECNKGKQAKAIPVKIMCPLCSPPKLNPRLRISATT